MKYGKAILVTLAALALLQTLTLVFRAEPIEADLLRTSRQRIAIAQAGIGIDQVSFEGRDATLEGPVASEDEKRRIGAVLSAYPVRVLVNNLTVDPSLTAAAPTDVPEAEVLFTLSATDSRQMRLSGRLPDSATRDRFLQAIRDAFPTHAVTDETTLDAAFGEWIEGFVTMLPAINAVQRPTLRVSPAAIALRGDVPTPLQRAVVVQDAEAALAGARPLLVDLRVLETVGPPEAAAVVQMRTDLEAVLAGHKVQFLINTAELVPASKELLDRVAAVLDGAESVIVEVQGHTDILGSVALNNALSQSRADAVRDYLVTRGIRASRLSAIGFGPTRPVATNTTLEGRIKNRRVEFSLKGGQ